MSAPASARVSVKMVQSNGRAEQIRSLLGKHCRSALELSFEIEAGDKKPDQPGPQASAGTTGKKNELISDPAVKTVLLGLDATVTGIEDNT